MNSSLIRPIQVIAQASYKEIIRDRLLYGIFLVAALVTASSFFMATISLGQDSRIMENIGLASIHAFAVFICVFVTSNSLYHDMDRRALYLLLPKPISRSQYVAGKFLGMVYLLLTALLILGGLFAIGVALTDPSLLWVLPVALAFSFLEISLLIGFALLFASFTAPLNASLYTIALYFIGHSLSFIKEYITKFGPVWEQKLIGLVYYVFPNLQKFDVRSALLYHVPISANQVLWTLVYWVFYLGLVLVLTAVVMRKREV